MAVEVTLSAGEMAVAQQLAAMRNAVARAGKVRNAKMGPQSDYQTDLDGLVAEIAFAKMMNVYPDLSVYPRHGGVDAVVNGIRIDVKSTRYPHGHLVAVIGKESDAVDRYVLGHVNDNMVRFFGWATSDELIRQENMKDFGHGSGYALPQQQLHPFKETPQEDQ